MYIKCNGKRIALDFFHWSGIIRFLWNAWNNRSESLVAGSEVTQKSILIYMKVYLREGCGIATINP